MFLHIIGILLMTYVNLTPAQVPNSFTTQRIRAEKVTNAHANYLAEILSNPKVQGEYNTTDEKSFAIVSSQLSIINNQWEQYGYGLYVIFDIETSEFIGFVGFHTVIIDECGTIDCFNNNKPTKELEIYILLMPNNWRKGYGFEATTKLIELAFKYLHYTSIIAYIEPKNHASLRFIKKLNFTEENRVMYNSKPHILYRLHNQ